MEHVNLKYIEGFDHRSLVGKIPKRSQYKHIYYKDTIFHMDGKPVMLHVILDDSITRPMRDLSKRVKVHKGIRSNGIPKKSSVFGCVPRSASRSDYCRFTRQTHEDIDGFRTVVEFGKTVSDLYRRYFPDKYKLACDEISSTVDPDWLYHDIPYLTCNFNINHAIKHHRDSGNFKSHLSNVLILKNDISGGELVCPEFGIALGQADNSLTIFDGQGILHGVMPIKSLSEDSYRSSIVYYTLSGMKNCLNRADELSRFQLSRTAKESVNTEDRRAKVMEMNKRILKG
jgi:hypothetical protein